MSRKFKTTQEEMQDLLKYQLLHQAQQAKRYYEDSFYRPQTVINQELKKQQDFYNQIDIIASRVSSDLYEEDTAEGRYYMETTKSMAKKLFEELDKQFKQGILSSQQYNDLLGYVSSTIGTALAGANATISRRRMALQKDPVGLLVNTQLKKNLTQLSVPAIEQLAETAGETRQEIQRLKYAVQHELASALNIGSGMPAYPQNLSQPVPTTLEGERVVQLQDYEGQNSYKGTPQLPHTNNKHGMNWDQTGDGTESNNTATERYGLDQKPYEHAMGVANELLSGALYNNFDQKYVVSFLSKFVNKFKSTNPSFNGDKFASDVLAKFNELKAQKEEQKAGRENQSNSAQAQAGEDFANANQNYDDFASQLDDRMPPPKHSRKAQANATQGNITPEEQYAYSLGTYLSGPVKEVLNNIDTGEQPTRFGQAKATADAMEEQLIEDLNVVPQIIPLLRVELFPIVSTADKNALNQMLYKLKALFSVESLTMILGKLKNADITKWRYYKNTEANIIDKVDDEEERNSALEQMENELKADQIDQFELALENVIKYYQDSEREYGLVWNLKRYISSTNIEPYEAYTQWVNALPENTKNSLKTGTALPAMSGKGRRRAINTTKIAGRLNYKAPDWKKLPVHHKLAVPAMTAGPLYKNPPMRFIAEAINQRNI